MHRPGAIVDSITGIVDRVTYHMWLDTHFSRYNQLLEQFAEAKGIELEEPELREIPPEVIGEIRQIVDRFKADQEGKPSLPDATLTLVSDHIDNPHNIKMVTPVAMKDFKMLRNHLLQSGLGVKKL